MVMRTTAIALLALLALALALSGCTVRPVQPVARPPAPPTLIAAQAQLDADLRAVITAEVQAHQAGDAEALAALLDPAADPQWLADQRARLDLPITGVEVQRLFGSGDLILAAVVETQAQDGNLPLTNYGYRVLRHTPDGWKLTGPTAAAWGEPMTMTVGTITLAYRAFDDPYVRTIAPRLERALGQMVADFGLGDATPPTWSITVEPFAAAGSEPAPVTGPVFTVTSPVALPFPEVQAGGLEEFLLGFTVDNLGHGLLSYAYGAAFSEPGRLALGHAAVQWEAEQATGNDMTAVLRREAELAAPGQGPTPLATLLDPTQFSAEGRAYADRNLFLRFLVERYGRTVMAPYLEAVFTADSADAIVEAATGEDLATVEAAWHAWLASEW